jgi:hypothetical protein
MKARHDRSHNPDHTFATFVRSVTRWRTADHSVFFDQGIAFFGMSAAPPSPPQADLATTKPPEPKKKAGRIIGILVFLWAFWIGWHGWESYSSTSRTRDGALSALVIEFRQDNTNY